MANGTSIDFIAEITQAETKQPYSLEAADANAIEEVNFAYENVKEVECLDITKEGSEAWDAAVKRYEERIGELWIHFTICLRFSIISFIQIVLRHESLLISVTNWEQPKMPTKCSASFRDSMRCSFVRTSVVL